MDLHEINRVKPDTSGDPLTFIFHVKYLRIGSKVFTKSHGSQMMNPNDFRDPLIFSLAPPPASSPCWF